MQKSNLKTTTKFEILKKRKLDSGKQKVSIKRFALGPPRDSSLSSTREQLRQLLNTLKLVRRGDFSVRVPSKHEETLISEIGEVLNDIIELNQHMANEFLHIITSVAKGDLSQKMSLEIDGKAPKGEFLRIGTTVNKMVDQLNFFTSEVARVVKEVGTEGKLSGQAKVPGASGAWKNLTASVNHLAGNLTRSIPVEAQREVAALKFNINQMIENLKETTEKNKEQDWLKTNLAKFSSMMQGQRSITSVARLIMSELTPLVDSHHGAFFIFESENQEASLNLIASYAFPEHKKNSHKYKLKDGLVGQCAFEKKRIILRQTVTPKHVIVLPVLFEGELKAVIELASNNSYTQNYITFLDQLMGSIGVILNMISSSMRTEELLQELKRSNAELEEKAEQLSLISKYKSEFLANMSHELRTPLNSLLILSKMLAENRDKNLNSEQVKFASTVHSAGQDLLALINEILDLSKVEAGKMQVTPKTVEIKDIRDYLEQTFKPVAEHKGLGFSIRTSDNLPKTIYTDESRLQQILKNLLSNAFKFTSTGQVTLGIALAGKKRNFPLDTLTKAKNIIVFQVIDTGIGIPIEKQKLIFEAFQQADGTTSRKYGGTGLGLTISRKIAHLLGGIIEVESQSDQGSTFTLCLPLKYTGTEAGTNLLSSLETSNVSIPIDAWINTKESNI